MEYQTVDQTEKKGSLYEETKVHSWRPPCSCGVDLVQALEEKTTRTEGEKGKLHFWRPPCSCGVSLDEVVE